MSIRIQHHDSPFGKWLMAHWSPVQLSAVLDQLWYFEGTVAVPRERVFPDGRVDLIVHLGPVYRQVTGERTDPFSISCISGLLLTSNVVEAPPDACAVLGLRLRPAGAFALLARALPELVGITVDLGAVLGNAADELAARCYDARQPGACGSSEPANDLFDVVAHCRAEARLRAAAEWVDERCRQHAPDPAVAWAAQEIERHAGALSIAALRERTGWSKTRFTATFQQQVGVPPKVFARIHRFRHALQLLHAGDTPLARVALRSGYYDQSHFNAEFRELSGFAPGEFLAARRYPGSGSIAEDSI